MNMLRSARENLVVTIHGLDQAALSQKTDAESWSALQVLDHVQIAERNIVLLLDRLSSRARGRGRLEFADMIDVPVNVTLSKFIPRYDSIPAFPGTEPATDRSLSEIQDRLDESRAQLLKLAKIGRDHDCSRLITPHPVAGRLNYYEWLCLVAEHDRVHTEQIVSPGQPATPAARAHGRGEGDYHQQLEDGGNAKGHGE